ncbi:MAG: hypothetical protein KGD59_11760 [Candidatus Heimdallarchaeota archaeon]|nr:hypothetical protein [Candidatus Heimdallarchaeota archaeon]
MRRGEILQQRGNKCEKCGSTEKLHVHHKKGRDDILDKDLEVLCQKCHMTKSQPRNVQHKLE